MVAEEGDVGWVGGGVGDAIGELGEDGSGAELGGVGCGLGGWLGGGAGVGERDGLQHEGLGKEGATDASLFLDGADAEGGEGFGAGEAAGVEEEDGGLVCVSGVEDSCWLGFRLRWIWRFLGEALDNDGA